MLKNNPRKQNKNKPKKKSEWKSITLPNQEAKTNEVTGLLWNSLIHMKFFEQMFGMLWHYL